MPKTVTTVDTKSSKSPQIPPAITYRLSEKYFLDLGWTAKPNILSVRSVVTMRAKFSHPMLSPWLNVGSENVKRKYPNGKILCLMRSDGTGKIYYPNGKVAISIEKETVSQHRVRLWLYSSGEVERNGIRHPYQLCGLFDSLGNGVVYDHHMNKRLVYNQKEGVLWDTPSGVPVTWQWHDIPYTGSLSNVNGEGDDKSIVTEVTKVSSNPPGSKSGVEEKESRRAEVMESPAELSVSEHAFLEKLEKWRFLITEKFVPRTLSPIKPITLSINKYISLLIMSQSEIFLRFFASGRHTQLKIGVLYNPYEVLKVTDVNSEFFDRERVLCSFESFPAKTQSMMKFKKLISNQKMEP